MRMLTATGLEISFGDRHILRGCNLTVDEGQKVGLVGANGSGKSTLLSLLAGDQGADFGTIDRRGSVAFLPQAPRLVGPTVGDDADRAVAWHADLLTAYEVALDEERYDDAANVQARLDQEGWEVGHRVEAMLDRLDAPPRDALVANLSGGESRRVALALALLRQPDLLVLDEPTNHLDADTVEWLQGYLEGYRGAILIVTHDRYLLEAVAEHIVEVDDGVCVGYEGSYTDYLLTRAERRASMERAEDKRLSMIASEAEWASRSPAARSTKQRARLERLDALRSKRGLKRERNMELNLSTGLKTGRSVLEVHGLTKGYDGRTLIDGLELHLMAGDRVGILGPNGCGKSTLLRLLTQVEEPDAGEVIRAPRFKVAVLDQGRTGLTDSDTVFEAAGGGGDYVTVGNNSLHVASFLRRFLFERESHTQRVSTLSGGERARLLLARLLLQGCNLLVLDEPTNDLDLQTLRVLEEALLNFDGALLVVTHDRAFLDRVCTRVFAFEGEGHVQEYASRVQHVRAMAERSRQAERARRQAKQGKSAKPKAQAKKALSFKEQQEFDALPARIEVLETEQGGLEAKLADPATYQEGDGEVRALSTALSKVVVAIATAYARWEELEARASA